MIKQLKKWWQQRKLRQRLRKMEKALQLQLTTMQRVLVLDPKPPRELAQWPRRSGKTTCACLHMLLHAPISTTYRASEAIRLLPDPDTFISAQTARWTYKYLLDMYVQLRKAGIRTCGLQPPSMREYSTFGFHGKQYEEGRRDLHVGVYANRG